jgi:CheY-like chemotaxis protein
VPQLGLAMDAFFARALSVDPAARFQSATDFATELVGLSDAKRPVISALFIDDEPDMELLVRQQFRRELREGRYEFHFALDGQAGMDELRRRPEIDVVFTDLNMPNMDGLTFLRRVPEVNPLVRVVVVSAYSDMSNIRAAMNLGAFDFLGKPIDFDDLERTMTKCASGAPSLRQSLRARQENDILRALVGASAVDRLVTSLRASRTLGEESFEGTVAFVRIPDFEDLHAARAPATTIYGHLNAHFELFGPDILAQGGVVVRFIGAALLAVFRGEGHLVRGLDACVAIRERMRALPPEMTRGMVGEGGASIGLDTGALMAGGTGSLAIGRIEQTLLGDPVLNAGRLVIVAGRNEILVPARVQALGGSLFAFEPQERTGPGAEAPAVVRVIGRPRAGSADGPRAAHDTKGAATARAPTLIGRG